MNILAIITVIGLLISNNTQAFCGFYVAKADAGLFNKASQVVLVRDENKTVISMMNDYEGKLQNFALVVPVPTILKRGQINVGKKKLFSRIDSFTAPRLVEYFDPDPCEQRVYSKVPMPALQRSGMKFRKNTRKKNLGVKVEAEYTVGEYDIVILSAKESDGLETWLKQNGYSIPTGASQALAPYIKQNMKFFVAKVNLKEQVKTGLTYLRPLQFAFESEKFMLPIRLGMVNAKGPQELFIYILTKNGRVETTNYQTVKLPTDMKVPVYVKSEFSDFYRAMFDQQVKKERMKTVFTEYFWDMGWCDPCAADPLSADELKGLGVFWAKNNDSVRGVRGRRTFRPSGAQPVKVTRLHVRYTKETFPDDLMFQETNDTKNFQGRYILNHPWKGKSSKCNAAKSYLDKLPTRFEKEAQNLATLTGWNINDIRKKMNFTPSKKEIEESRDSWWKNLW